MSAAMKGKRRIRTVQVFARDPAYTGELDSVGAQLPLCDGAVDFDDDVLQLRRGGEVFWHGAHPGVELEPIPYEGFAPSVLHDGFKAQMLSAVIRRIRALFAQALGREPAWWGEGPLMVRFDCLDRHQPLPNAYYRRLPRPPRTATPSAPSAAPVSRTLLDEIEAARRTGIAEPARTILLGKVTERLMQGTSGQADAERQHLLLACAWLELGAKPEAWRVRVAKWWSGALEALNVRRAPTAPAVLPAAVPPDAGTGQRTDAHAAMRDSAAASPDERHPGAAPRQELCFGTYVAGESGVEQQGARVPTALMHDVIVHECVHALMDGLRPHLLHAPNSETLAFHEGFADMVAVFSRFANRDLVRLALSHSPDLKSDLLVDIGTQFGFTATRQSRALRSAILDDPDPASGVKPKRIFDSFMTPHELGNLLLTAVFAAFRLVFQDKSRELRQLAGTHPGEAGLDLLAARASRLGTQFLGLLVRALDYLPPVDVRFGDYLRALITADQEDYPVDEWRYRDRLVEQFRRYRIPVLGFRVDSADHLQMHASALAWDVAVVDAEVEALLDRVMAVWPNRTCAHDPSTGSVVENAFSAGSGLYDALGLVGRLRVEVGRLWQSERVVDGERVVRERGIELIQHATHADIGRLYGGTTLLMREIDGAWRLRYAISRSAASEQRASDQRHYLSRCDRSLARLWRGASRDGDFDGLAAALTRHLHDRHPDTH